MESEVSASMQKWCPGEVLYSSVLTSRQWNLKLPKGYSTGRSKWLRWLQRQETSCIWVKLLCLVVVTVFKKKKKKVHINSCNRECFIGVLLARRAILWRHAFCNCNCTLVKWLVCIICRMRINPHSVKNPTAVSQLFWALYFSSFWGK